MAKPVPLEERDRFEKLWESYVDNFKAYIANIMATITAVMVAIGWLISSNEAQRILSTSRLVRILSIGVIIAVFVIHNTISIEFCCRSVSKKRCLCKYQDLDPLPVSDYRIPYWLLIINIILNACLLAVLAALVLSGKVCQIEAAVRASRYINFSCL